MITFLTILHILIALFIILVVLLQGGNQGGVSAAFGGGNTSGVFGATGATSLLAKVTYGMAAAFMITSLTLSVLKGKSTSVGLTEELRGIKAPVETVVPPTAPTTPPAEPAESEQIPEVQETNKTTE